MQSYKFDEVIKNACDKRKLNPELMKSFSNFIFTKTKEEMHRFSHLRIYLKGLFAFFYGKKRLERVKEKLDNKLNKTNHSVNLKHKISYLENKTPDQLISLDEDIERLLQVYNDYITEKNITKKAYRESKTKKDG